ncbi:MAG: NAD(P)/FAD-dependent oxidoreductase [Planctomycetes bacterium]|nr:NAD(P)/FAD-dependent oxidoreductase [Planctomycetota bacterium]
MSAAASPNPVPELPHVVIVGAGFGGLYAARALRHAPVRVTLLDRRNHHLFQALLYQVATAGLNPSDIAYPIRRVFRDQPNVTVLLGEARAIDVARRRVLLADGEVGYDHLIVATGATHSYFGRDEWATHAPGLKSVEDALDIRRRVLLAYEAAERAPDGSDRREWLTFVVVGAGPTGVELAGALGELSRHALVRDFRRIDPSQARILLLEGGDRVLPSYPPALSQKARIQLAGLGVEVRTGARVTGIDEHGVLLGDERIAARTMIWAAGVAASPLARTLNAPLDRAGRVQVNPDLTVPGRAEVFVIGDLAAVEQDGKLLPGNAPVAIQQARHTAANIERAIRQEAPLPFRYEDPGMLATIGRAAAVGVVGGVQLSGLIAWLAWLAVHLLKIIGFRNRLLVLVSWAWAYIRWERGARLITGDHAPPATSAPAATPAIAVGSGPGSPTAGGAAPAGAAEPVGPVAPGTPGAAPAPGPSVAAAPTVPAAGAGPAPPSTS